MLKCRAGNYPKAGTLKFDALRIPFCVSGDWKSTEIWQRIPTVRAKPQERAELQRAWIEDKSDNATARLLSEPGVNTESADFRSPKCRLELDMSNNGIRLENQIVTTIVHLWLQDFQTLDSGKPYVSHYLTANRCSSSISRYDEKRLWSLVAITIEELGMSTHPNQYSATKAADIEHSA